MVSDITWWLPCLACTVRAPELSPAMKEILKIVHIYELALPRSGVWTAIT